MKVCGLPPINKLLPRFRLADEVGSYGAIYGFVRRVTHGEYGPPLLLHGPMACGKSRLARAIRESLGLEPNNCTFPGGGLKRSQRNSFREVIIGWCAEGERAIVLRDFCAKDLPCLENVIYDLRVHKAGLIIETSSSELAVRLLTCGMDIDDVGFTAECLDAKKEVA